MRTLAVVVSLLVPASAVADAPCSDEADAARKAGRDPSLASPRDPAAVTYMKTASAHLDEGLKRAAVVATRDHAAAEYQAAIDSYVAAAMISTAPVVLYNLAHTYRTAGDYPHAIEQYRSFLDHARPGPVLRALVECHIATMTAELERAASTAPPIEPAPVDDPPPPVAAPSETPIPATMVGLVVAPSPWHHDPVAWVLTGTGAAATGAGVFLLIDAADLREKSNDPRRSDDVRKDLVDQAHRRQWWGTAATVAGAALLTAGVAKLILTPDAAHDARASMSLRLTPGGLAVRGTF